MKHSAGNKTSARRRIFLGIFYAVGLAVLIFAAIGLYNIFSEDTAARDEYNDLREIANSEITHIIATEDDNNNEPELGSEAENEPWRELIALNPDFVGWIEIPATDVDYPIVRGTDNDYYLRRTFLGESNSAGTIFMDYRAIFDFNTHITILYGHNMRDGSMFASLMRYTDATFLADNTEIRIFTRYGETFYYDVISATRTHALDDVYSLDFHNVTIAQNYFNHNNSEHFLVLSTCWSGPDRTPTDRLIVIAARRP